MSFQYSSFISYRHNGGDKQFLKNFKELIESEAQKVTNKPEAFIDDEIKWGKEFDDKIYDSIATSFFFIPIYHFGYLNIDNVWCAREVFHALKVEQIIRDAIGNDNFCYILPIIFRGSPSSLPVCIGKKTAKDIKKLEYSITSKNLSAACVKFKQEIYNDFLENFNLLTGREIDLKELCSNIEIPTDEEIINWIKEQKENIKRSESANPPIFKKNGQ